MAFSALPSRKAISWEWGQRWGGWTQVDDKKFWKACGWSRTRKQGRALLDSVEAPLEARGKGTCFPRGNPLLRAAQWRVRPIYELAFFPESWPKRQTDWDWGTEESVTELMVAEIPSKPFKEKSGVKKWLPPMALTLQCYVFTPDFRSRVSVYG